MQRHVANRVAFATKTGKESHRARPCRAEKTAARYKSELRLSPSRPRLSSSISDSQLHPRFRVKIQAELFPRVFPYDGIQVANAPIGENDQVAMSVNVAYLGKPWLARPLMGR